jgi:hypothetical protein
MNTVSQSDIRSDEALEALFAKAAARPLPRADHEDRIREQVRAVWQQCISISQRRRRTYMSILAIAVSAAVVAVIGMLVYQTRLLPAGSDPVAVVAKRFGNLHVADASGVPYYSSADRFAILPGQSISTDGKSGMALTWSNGGSLRLDEYTTISVASANEIYLQRGRLYFDSGSAVPDNTGPGDRKGAVLTIRTDHGLVTPMGTRYVTQQRNDQLMVLVRQGEVSVKGTTFAATALAGERLLVAGDSAPNVVPVASYGDEWRWIEKTTPAWDTEGKTIFEFLSWVSRESGMSLRFDSSSAEDLARKESLVGYGQVDLEPSIALQVVLMTTDLDWTVKDGIVVISKKHAGASTGPL